MTEPTEAIDRHMVVQVGMPPRVPGGIAQVVAEFASWSFERVKISTVYSTRRKGLLDDLRCIRTTLKALFSVRRSTDSGAVAVHISQRGSFIREGSIVAAASLLRLPVIIHLHGSSFPDYSDRHPRICRAVITRSDAVVVLTQDSAAAVQTLTKGRRKPAVVKATNAVAMPPEPTRKSKIIFMAGELASRKGIDVLLKAWSTFNHTNQGWQLHLAGPISDETLAQVRQTTAVRYLGSLTRPEVYRVLSQAQFAVLPSRAEALPMFLIEAMAHGCIPISTRVGNIPDLINDSNGFLVEPGDSEGLLAALQQATAGDQAAIDRLADSSRRTVDQRFSEQAVRKSIEDAWLNAIKSTRSQRDRKKSSPGPTNSGSAAARPTALLVASTGGHLAQLTILEPHLRVADDSEWVTFKNSQSNSLLEGRAVTYVPYIRSRGYFDILRATPPILRTVARTKFDVVVSSGAAVAVPSLVLARLLGKRAVYIESISRVKGPSLSGKIVQKVPGIETFTQHPSWADSRWLIGPSVLQSYRADEQRHIGNDKKLDIFVTLGTIRPYRFDKLVDRVANQFPDDRITWQLGCTERDDIAGTVLSSVSADQFDKLVADSDVVISHSGVGSAIRILELGKVPVLVPRRRVRGEHVDDHQEEIAQELTTRGLAVCSEVAHLERSDVLRAASFVVERCQTGTAESDQPWGGL